MLILTLIGLKKCGKTTTAEALIGEFRKRGYRVGSVKFMPNSTLTLDVEGKDTWRHREAGAEFVISLSRGEIGYIGDVEGRAQIEDALRLVPEETDILICEGYNTSDPRIMKIILARDPSSLKETIEVRGVAGDFLAVSGIISGTDFLHPDLPVLDATSPDQLKRLADLIIEKGKLIISCRSP
jgi:molybdopterin-guanine dinucleotide biosynthesis protein B